jgi:NADH-quinone oxidoreductase subunit L
MLAAGGVVTAWYFYLINPAVPTWIKKQFHFIYVILDNKYYMDKFNEVVFAGGARRIGSALSNVGDRNLIDGLIVNGSGRVVNWCSGVVRTLQTGYIYHYAFTMILAIALYLGYLLITS